MAGCAALQPEQQRRIQTLYDKQQRSELTPSEQAEEEALCKLYRAKRSLCTPMLRYC